MPPKGKGKGKGKGQGKKAASTAAPAAPAAPAATSPIYEAVAEPALETTVTETMSGCSETPSHINILQNTSFSTYTSSIKNSLVFPGNFSTISFKAIAPS